MLKTICIVLVSLFLLSARAQNCGFQGVDTISLPQTAMKTDILLYIPVVVHLVENENSDHFVSDRMVYDQIKALNRDFNRLNHEIAVLPSTVKASAAEAKIHFYLAPMNPFGVETSGITRTITTSDNLLADDNIFYTSRGGKDPWPNDKYLNIWVVDLPPGLFGFSSSPTDVNQYSDGVVVGRAVFGVQQTENFTSLGRSLVHEIGHYLGLLHPWGNLSQECEEDDGIEDTPVQFQAHTGCPPQENHGCYSQTPSYWNFMDYTSDCCMALFTNGQVSIMRNVLLGIRTSLVEHGAFLVDKEHLLQFDRSLVVYPNPANDFFSIDWTASSLSQSQEYTLTFYNTQGNIVFETILSKKQNGIELCTANLPRGLLLLSISNQDGLIMQTAKIIIL